MRRGASLSTTICHRFERTKSKTPVCIAGRLKRGIYAGKGPRFTDRVSHSGRRTRRKISPSVVHKKVYSEILDQRLPLRVTTTALRFIDRYGGLDNYLTKSHPFRLGKGMVLQLREKILEAKAGKAQREELELLLANMKITPTKDVPITPWVFPESTKETSA